MARIFLSTLFVLRTDINPSTGSNTVDELLLHIQPDILHRVGRYRLMFLQLGNIYTFRRSPTLCSSPTSGANSLSNFSVLTGASCSSRQLAPCYKVACFSPVQKCRYIFFKSFNHFLEELKLLTYKFTLLRVNHRGHCRSGMRENTGRENQELPEH